MHNVNYRLLICCPCHFQRGSLIFVYFGFLCLQVSSVSHLCPDTRGRRWSLIEAHLFSCVVGREGHCKQVSLACVGSARSVWTTLDLPQPKAACVSRVYTAQAPEYSARALSEVGPTFHALPRSKSVRFLCTLQGHRHGLVHVLCPSQVRAVQVTRCLMSALSRGTVRLNHLPGPSHSGVSARAASQVCHVSPLGS